MFGRNQVAHQELGDGNTLHIVKGSPFYTKGKMMEKWKYIPGYEAYEVSTNGRVRRGGKFLKLTPVQSGRAKDDYKPLCVSLSRFGKVQSFKVAYLVLLTFIGKKPPRTQIRHFDDDQENNRLSNLAWGSSKDNGGDRVKNGLTCPGSSNPNAVLTEDTVRKIRSEYIRGSKHAGLQALSRRYGISDATVHQITTRKTWRHI